VESQLGTFAARAKSRGLGGTSYGAIMLVKNLDEAADLANANRGRAFEIIDAGSGKPRGKIRNAGAIFLGSHTPEAIGDYVGGSTTCCLRRVRRVLVGP